MVSGKLLITGILHNFQQVEADRDNPSSEVEPRKQSGSLWLLLRMVQNVSNNILVDALRLRWF